MTEAKQSRNVYQRFSEACKIIGSQQWVKDMENSQYKSIPIDDMRKGVRQACAQVGLVHVGPVNIKYDRVIQDRTSRYIGTCEFIYVNIDDPDEQITFERMGESMDNGDKAVGKFVTNCIKNHYKAAFDIGEQGKDDVDSYSNDEYYERDAKLAEYAAKSREYDAKNRIKTEEPLRVPAAKTGKVDRFFGGGSA